MKPSTLFPFIRNAIAICLSAGVLSSYAIAAEYPNKPITIVTPTAAGGGTDTVARLVADRIAPLLEQPVIVDNKPGAGGTIGNQYMLREKNDGYSLFVT